MSLVIHNLIKGIIEAALISDKTTFVGVMYSLLQPY